jgi:hypothetical protein
MMVKRFKRPLYLNQSAKQVVDLATMDDKQLAALREGLKLKTPRKKLHRPGKRASSSET